MAEKFNMVDFLEQKYNCLHCIDLTLIIVESTRSMVQLAMQRADSTRKFYVYSHSFVSNQQAHAY
jgi:hypothetical protein